MRFRLALLALLLAGAAHAQAPSPAQIGVSPTPPQSLFWLDSTKTWQPIPAGIAGQTNTFNFTTVPATISGVANVGTQSPLTIGGGNAYSFAPYGAFLTMNATPLTSPPYPPTHDLRSGLILGVNPGNISYDVGSAFHFWNYTIAKIDTYWTDQTKTLFNVGQYVDMQFPSLPACADNGNVQPCNAVKPNGSSIGFRVRNSLLYPTNPDMRAAGAVHNFVGNWSEVYALNGDGGNEDTVASPGSSAGVNVIPVTTPANWAVNDNAAIVYNSGAYSGRGQALGLVTAVGGGTVTVSIAPAVATTAGDSLINAKGAAYSSYDETRISTAGLTNYMSSVAGQEYDLNVRGGKLLYKWAVGIVTVGTDKVSGTLWDAGIAIYGAVGTVGLTDVISVGTTPTGVWPLKATGTVLKVHSPPVGGVNQAAAYGVDLSWATFTSAAFAFSTTGSGVPDNYWNNTVLHTTGPLQVGTTNTTIQTRVCQVCLTGASPGYLAWDRNAAAGAVAIIQASGAASGGSNLAGGELRLYPGTSTGSGVSDVAIYAFPGVAAATVDNTPTKVAQFNASGLTLSVLPTSGDGTGLNLCAQSNGVVYRKATCP